MNKSLWHIGLIRPYAPNPDLDWANLDFSLNWLGRFADPAVQDEFTRFANRDMVSNGISLGFAGALFAWPILFPNQFGAYMTVQHLCIGGVTLILSLVLGFLIIYGEFDTQRARVRSVLTTIATFLVTVGDTTPDVYFFVKCRETRDLFSSWMPYMNPDPANYQHDCIRVMDSYLIISMAINIAIGTFHPLTAFTMSIIGMFLSYTGYYTAPGYDRITAGETWKELGLKMVMYFFTLTLTVALQAVLYRQARRQFEAAAKTYLQAKLTKKRSEDVDALLCAMVPATALDRLLSGDVVRDSTPCATVLFSDMASFTSWSSTRSTDVVVSMLNTVCIQLDHLAHEMRIEKVKTIGDAYWAVTGLPDYVEDHAAMMVKFGLQMHQIVRKATSGKPEWGTVRFRTGVHSGPLRGGIFGTSRLSYEVFGDTSDIAEQCEKTGVPERITITETTRHLLGHDVDTDSHGFVECHGRRVLTFLVNVSAPDAVSAKQNPLDSSRFTSASPPTSLSVMSASLSSAFMDANEAPRSEKSVQSQTQRFERERRQKFVQDRAKRAADLDEAQHAASDAVRDDLTRRRWSWFLLTFANDAIESEYEAFIKHTQLWMRRLTRGLMLTLIALQILIAGLDRPGSVGTASWVLLPIAFAMDLTLLLSSWVDVLPLPLEALGFFGVILVDTVGCGLVHDSIVGNDPLYIFTLVAPLVAIGVSSLPWIVIIVLLIGNSAFPVWYFTYNSILFVNSVAFISFSLLIVALGAVTFEKMLRQQFVEHKVQQHEHELQLRREQEQRALLEAIVPTHVIAPLQQWLETDMDVKKTIAEKYPAVCVGFLKVLEPTAYAAKAALREQPVDELMEEDMEWLFDAHNKIDAAIAAEQGAFDKIKTIGATVMIAGSFQESYSAQASGAAMLRCVARLLRDGVAIRFGLHVGEVMGAVLGTERLCFDIFGDTVNVASRVLTTLQLGEAGAVSEQFFETVCGDSGEDTDSGLPIGSAVARAAKGKGHILVRPTMTSIGVQQPSVDIAMMDDA